MVMMPLISSVIAQCTKSTQYEVSCVICDDATAKRRRKGDPLSDRQYPSLTYSQNSSHTTISILQYKLTMDSTETSQTSGNQALSVGWIGLGSMGLAMAVNIQKHLKATGAPNLHYWNRTISKGQELAELGGVACENVADVPRNCDITFISVSHTHNSAQLKFTSH
jgi:hypothetical protein